MSLKSSCDLFGGKLSQFLDFHLDSLVFWVISMVRHFCHYVRCQDLSILKCCILYSFQPFNGRINQSWQLKFFFTVFEISADENFTLVVNFSIMLVIKDLTMQYDASWREDSKYVFGYWSPSSFWPRKWRQQVIKIVNLHTIFFGSNSRQMGHSKRWENMCHFMRI